MQAPVTSFVARHRGPIVLVAVVLAAFVFGLWWLGANPQYAYYGTLAMSGYAATVVALRAVRHQGRLVLHRRDCRAKMEKFSQESSAE